jgi:hypothetical protein
MLQVNIAIAIFVLLANGSALVLGLSGKAPEVLANLTEVVLILAVAIAVFGTAILALAKLEYRQKVLTFHAVSFAVGAIALALWGLSLAFHATGGSDIPAVKVTWSAGWLTAFAAYSAFLVTQTLFAHARTTSIVVKYSYLWVGAIALAVDVFVFSRLAASVVS